MHHRCRAPHESMVGISVSHRSIPQSNRISRSSEVQRGAIENATDRVELICWCLAVEGGATRVTQLMRSPLPSRAMVSLVSAASVRSAPSRLHPSERRARRRPASCVARELDATASAMTLFGMRDAATQQASGPGSTTNWSRHAVPPMPSRRAPVLRRSNARRTERLVESPRPRAARAAGSAARPPTPRLAEADDRRRSRRRSGQRERPRRRRRRSSQLRKTSLCRTPHRRTPLEQKGFLPFEHHRSRSVREGESSNDSRGSQQQLLRHPGAGQETPCPRVSGPADRRLRWHVAWARHRPGRRRSTTRRRVARDVNRARLPSISESRRIGTPPRTPSAAAMDAISSDSERACRRSTRRSTDSGTSGE